MENKIIGEQFIAGEFYDPNVRNLDGSIQCPHAVTVGENCLAYCNECKTYFMVED